MKVLVFFREGTGGNFFKTLFENQDLGEAGLRVDPWLTIKQIEYSLQSGSQPLVTGPIQITIAHASTSDAYKKYHTVDPSGFDLVLRILPHHQIYKTIWNNFHKKIIIEEKLSLESWQQDLTFWFDKCYYNIGEYYQLHKSDIVNNVIANVIDFDRIEDVDYLESVSQKYFSSSLTSEQIRFIQSYQSKQLNVRLSDDLEQDMSRIVSEIPRDRFAKDPWFASYCVFKYEKNRGLSESDRAWSVDQFDRYPGPDQLISIADQYRSQSA